MSKKDKSYKGKVDTSTIGGRVRHVRKLLGLTQRKLAEICGISLTTMTDIEVGRVNAGHVFLKNFAEKLDVNLYYVLFGTGEPFRGPGDKSMEGFPSFTLDDHDRDFLIHYFNSDFVRFNILGLFRKLKIENAKIIQEEIAEAKKKKESS
jgi:transcriptional regulator with XRE-family HTH domain